MRQRKNGMVYWCNKITQAAFMATMSIVLIACVDWLFMYFKMVN